VDITVMISLKKKTPYRFVKISNICSCCCCSDTRLLCYRIFRCIFDKSASTSFRVRRDSQDRQSGILMSYSFKRRDFRTFCSWPVRWYLLYYHVVRPSSNKFVLWLLRIFSPFFHRRRRRTRTNNCGRYCRRRSVKTQ